MASETLNTLNEELEQLVAEACRHPADSKVRKKCLTKVVAKMQQKFSTEAPSPIPRPTTPNEREAQQRAWLWFCEHIEEYDPSKGTVIGWFSSHLRYRRKDVRANPIGRDPNTSSLDDKSKIRSGDEIASDQGYAFYQSEHEIQKDLATQKLITNQRRLRRIYFRDRPDVNCFDISMTLLEGVPLADQAPRYGLKRE